MPPRNDIPARKRPRKGASPIAHDAPTQENITLFEGEGNELSAQMQATHRIDPRARKIVVAAVALVVVYVVALIVPKGLFDEAQIFTGYNAGYTFSWFVFDLQQNASGIVAALTGNDAQVGYSAVMFRYVVIGLSGAGLALCGAIYQGSFRNALVSPSSMGVMSGAGAGMMLWLLFYVDDDCSNVPWIVNITEGVRSTVVAGGDPFEYLWASYSMSICSFAGCALVAGLVLVTMALSKRNSTSGLMIVIMGQVFGGIVGAITSAVRYYLTEVPGFEAKLSLLNTVQIGSFYRDYSLIDVVAVLVPIALCVFVTLRFNQRMMVLSFGNEQARSMGVDAKRTQILVVAVATLLTAIIVSFCGRIGFVGFFVPHLARRMVGPNFRYLLPASMVLGALFVMAAYLVVSVTLGPTYETMVGMFISIGGATVFLVQALKGTASRQDAPHDL